MAKTTPQSDAWKAVADQPFSPNRVSTGKGLELDTTLRIAHALEYIAAQMGQINAKLDAIAAAVKKD